MSINRQQRRLTERQVQVTADGAPEPGLVEAPESRSAPRPSAPSGRRTSPRQFMHEVNVELRKVAWPSRDETANYSIVVFVALAVLMAFIFGLDLGFGHMATFLFK